MQRYIVVENSGNYIPPKVHNGGVMNVAPKRVVKYEGSANSNVGTVQKKSKLFQCIINHNSSNSKVAEMDPRPYS